MVGEGADNLGPCGMCEDTGIVRIELCFGWMVLCDRRNTDWGATE